MFARATDGTVVNLIQFDQIAIAAPWIRCDNERFEARIMAEKFTGGHSEDYMSTDTTLWLGNKSEANDKMVELWQVFQVGGQAFDFGQNGTPEPKEEPAPKASNNSEKESIPF